MSAGCAGAAGTAGPGRGKAAAPRHLGRPPGPCRRHRTEVSDGQAERLSVDGEEYHLADGAADYSLYDYIKDVERLEQIAGAYSHAAGYAVLLTNDRSHWTPSPNSIGAAFRLPDGKEVRGSGTWSSAAGAGSTKGYEREIVLGGAYTVRWHDYARVDASAGGTFRYMVISVPGWAPANPPSDQG